MAGICEVTKVSCEPCVLGAAGGGVGEGRRFRFVPTGAEDGGKKGKSLDSGSGCAENRDEHRGETGNGSRSGKKATIYSGVSGVGKSVAVACPRYGVTSVCGRRREMEDAISIRPDFVRLGDGHHFFGVFDGHGCSHVAESCRDRMHEMVAEEISTSTPGPDREWAAAMERSFTRMDVAGCAASSTPTSSCRCELQTPKCDHVGSTAVVAVVGPSRIVVANCGDSRAVLCRNGVAVPLSTDHKPDRPDELQRIESAGGRVIYWDGARVLGVLAMSRAIGDSYLKPYVIAEPEVTVTERLEGDECLILASDGLWDVVSNEIACEIARTCLRNGGGPAEEGAEGSDKACSDAAILLTKLALARHSMDNITVVVVDLRRS